MIASDLEKQIIKKFKEVFIQRKDIGTEYFEGDYKIMFDVIYIIIKQEGVKEDKNEKINSEFIIKTMLKAYIGRNLYSNEAFYPTIHKIDNTFNKAIEVLKDSKLYNSYNAKK